jgi:L-seryl-tRNA(Ser) seleniumtransferase
MSRPDVGQLLRRIPAVSTLLNRGEVAATMPSVPRRVVVAAVQRVTGQWRSRVLAEKLDPPDEAAMAAEVLLEVARQARPSLRRVINATGVVLHTNLGRAPLSASAAAALDEVACHYSNLELDLESGERGSRHDHVEALLCELLSAEAAVVVNNAAAALLLALASIAAGREAVVSRGELVEIGGSFRVPDVMAQSGVRLREVGTTNRTHLADYQRALGPDTAAILKVHTSNYRLVGFVAEAGLGELAELAHAHGLPLLDDVGSGCLLPLPGDEPLVPARLAAGVDLCLFSGDKLLGGPQAGIAVGRTDLVARMKKHPLARALRIDKLCLAALEATLRAYLDPERAQTEIPVQRALRVEPAVLEAAAGELVRAVVAAAGPRVQASLEQGTSQVGGGALPTLELPTWLCAVSVPGASPTAVAASLRAGNPPIMCRLQNDRLLFDPRTLLEGETALVAEGLAAALERVAG